MSSREPVAGTPADIAQWDAAAREEALKWVKKPGDTVTAVHFLGRLRRLEDRQVLEQLLAWGDFHTYYSISERDGNKECRAGVCSRTRAAADEELARWDGKAAGDEQPYAHQYRSLGYVEAEVRLTEPLNSKGNVYAHLIPAAVGAQGWAETKPAVTLVIRGSWWGEYAKGRSHRLLFEGVTPGRYWLKVVHDCRSPHPSEDQIVYRPEMGDYESISHGVFEVRAGQSTDAGSAGCTRLVR